MVRGRVVRWSGIALFAILWIDLCRQLSYTWDTNEQYAYGWFVPLLAIGLLWKKWPTRPAPHPKASPLWLIVLVATLALILLPVRVIHEINQNWSFCSYLLTIAVVVLSLYAVFLMGGWPWVRHFAFAICFILVAVNWPYRIENSLKHRMMNAVTALTVEAAGWLNIPALRHGNVIELATGSVGVEDACSGIRSLQSTIMAAFFLGELYLLKWPQRFLLLAIGVPLAFAFNVARTLFLTWQASLSGGAAVAKWHDSAGMTIFLVCFGCLWAIAILFKRKWSTSPCPPTSAVRPGTSDPGQQSSIFHLPSLMPRRFLVAVGCWSLLCIASTEAWYRAHETDPAQTTHWSAQFPTHYPNARKIPMDKEIKLVLKYDQGDALSWEEPDGTKWSAFFFRWRAGEATSRMAARDHRPEICLPSSGSTLQADLGIRFLPVHGLELPFRAYTFESAGRDLHVFFCLWEDGADKQTGLGRSKYLDRLDSVRAGRRRLGQQTLEFVVSGYASMEEAEQAVRQRLPGLIQLGASPGAVTSLDQQGVR